MTSYEQRGNEIRESAKSLVYEFMKKNISCSAESEGLTQSEIFKSCGFQGNDYSKASVSNQQYWVISLLYELQDKKLIERIADRGRWRLTAPAIKR